MKGKALLILAGITLASGAMTAQAAKPMTDADKQAAAKAVAQNHKNFNVVAPRTMAQANGTLRQTPNNRLASRLFEVHGDRSLASPVERMDQ